MENPKSPFLGFGVFVGGGAGALMAAGKEFLGGGGVGFLKAGALGDGAGGGGGGSGGGGGKQQRAATLAVRTFLVAPRLAKFWSTCLMRVTILLAVVVLVWRVRNLTSFDHF